MTTDELGRALLLHPRVQGLGDGAVGMVLRHEVGPYYLIVQAGEQGAWSVVNSGGRSGGPVPLDEMHALGWSLDLTNHATAGVLLGLLASSWQVQTDTRGPATVATWRSGTPLREHRGTTLGEALARALLAVEPL